MEKIFKYSWRMQYARIVLLPTILSTGIAFSLFHFQKDITLLIIFSAVYLFLSLVVLISAKFFESVKIDNANQLSSGWSFYSFFKIPIDSMSNISEYWTAGAHGSVKRGFIIKTKAGKFHRILHDLKEPQDFLNTLTSINPGIVYEKYENITSNTPSSGFYSKHGYKTPHQNRIIAIILFAIAIVALYLAIHTTLQNGGIM
jgi:hypothetical protein